jgi:predicted AlkP superfamily pyrophosphatase or phosphodiesterase
MSKVCLVGIDGLRLDVADAWAPTLRHLLRTGSLATIEMEVPTISGPGWTSLLTGADHAEHRVVDNTLVPGRNAELPDFLGQAHTADPSRTTFAGGSWPPLIDPEGVGPIVHARPEQIRTGQHTLAAVDGDAIGHRRADAEVAAAAVSALADGPDASFVYFGQVDETAHEHGAIGVEYAQAVRRVDDHLFGLIEVIGGRAERDGEDWSVVITTDHGHLDEGGHGGATAVERASFALACCYGPGVDRPGSGLRGWPATMAATDLTPRLLGLLDG